MTSQCSVEGCTKIAVGRGWCHGHWRRWKLGKPVEGPLNPQPKGPCSVEACNRVSYCKGLCSSHYQRLLKFGDVRADVLLSRNLEDRFWHYVAQGDTPNDCWGWKGPLVSNDYRNCGGYGFIGGFYAHRFAYTLLVGPIPDDREVDHLCHNADHSCPGGGALCLHRRCTNPLHLGLATRAENIRRSKQRITHCPQGHPYDERNTYRTDAGHRHCRTCHREKERKRRSLQDPQDIEQHSHASRQKEDTQDER